MAEGTLSLDVIQQHFEVLAVMDARGRSGVDFESFCVLMEQLEAAWQALAGREGPGPEPLVPQDEPGQRRPRSEEEEEEDTSVPREQCPPSPAGGVVSVADDTSRLQKPQQQDCDLPPSETAAPLPLPQPRSRLAASDVADTICSTSSDTLPQGDATSGSELLARWVPT